MSGSQGAHEGSVWKHFYQGKGLSRQKYHYKWFDRNDPETFRGSLIHHSVRGVRQGEEESPKVAAGYVEVSR